MQMKPLHQDFGMEILDVDLHSVTRDHLYPEIRQAFEEHSLLLFRNQPLDDEEHLALGRLFGPLEDREDRPEPKIAPVSNVKKEGGVTGENDTHTLNLKSNQLWHTDSTFLSVPALANILQARIVPTEGGQTELVSTRAGWNRLDESLKDQFRKAGIWHRYAHSRAKISKDLAKKALFTKWQDQHWRAVWPNPVTGEEALYIASHAFRIDGMEDEAAQSLIDDVISSMTRPEDIYSHTWAPGDILLWDERATLHRGTSWPYDQPRHLVSICISAQGSDGLDGMRVR